MNKKIKILDLGCGNNKIQGSIGMDFIKFNSVDIIHDLNVFPYPFKPLEFDEIYIKDTLFLLNTNSNVCTN